MNQQWLIENADIPIRYILTRESKLVESLLSNIEVSKWLSKLSERSNYNDIGAIHGSHDYRMENILGKCWILGLSSSIDIFADNMSFILKYLNEHIQSEPPEELSFGKIYHYRDHEKVLSCFLPLLGFINDHAVKYITNQRIKILYNFTKQKNYNIYIDGSKLGGVKKEWQPYIINPDLYSDGNIALPDIHDLLIFAGMYKYLPSGQQQMIETIVEWFLTDEYKTIFRRYGYFYVYEGSYSTKAVIFKTNLIDFENMIFDKGDLASLLFNVFIFSHFESAKKSQWLSSAICYLEQYKTESNRYKFPSHFIMENPDSYVVFGGHMNVGENKRNKLYNEVISTYWMERIEQNLLDR